MLGRDGGERAGARRPRRGLSAVDGRAAGEPDRELRIDGRAVHVAQRGQPDVMRMVERGEPFAAVEQHREFRRQRGAARLGLQHREEARGERRAVDERVGVAPGRRAEHHVAHVVARGRARLERRRARAVHQRPEPRVDQRAARARLAAGLHAAHLQVRAIGRLDHARAERARDGRDRARLRGGERAARQLDSAQAAVARGDDANEPRACARGACGGG
ncbi:Uncharacterised protein [Burkholderia pseudomallei]|nr:precorrin-3B synthase domain protein [Burkholderia pseudomallei]CAJ3898966.1 Uncharacterised protein [Burkholderia pseudomallei]CAJ4510788.1 Uncharacterised protein [Burkholderia pseudomallei]CAJ5221193.1 Uncharacterised protein [Burkholderia pseudomallei]CAJ5909993.1 Uncharacterised protein [Burkholderia pseudomallei]